MGGFQHERLRVYHVAVEFAADVYEIVALLPVRCRSLGDQLFRAATSIVLNIAEGAAEYPTAEKARFYRFSRRSAAECAAAAAILIRVGASSDPRLAQLAPRANAIAGMLTLLIHHVVKSNPRRARRTRSKEPEVAQRMEPHRPRRAARSPNSTPDPRLPTLDD